MKKLLAFFASCLVALPMAAGAADAGFPLDAAPHRSNDLAALQRGAKLFVNYCLNCHSANLMRYNRLTDLGLSNDQIKEHLLFSTEKIGDTMTVAMDRKDAKEWFGAIPPDLSVIARAKASHAGTGPDWLYTYLRAYYRDETKPTGWNNLVFPNVGMPHVLWERQGLRSLTTTAIEPRKADAEAAKTEGKAAGHAAWQRTITTYDVNGRATVKTEPLTNYHGHPSVEAKFVAADPAQALRYDNEVADLVGFLTYMAEPVQSFRKRLGVGVLLFLGVFFFIAWRLNASYWKDVK